MADEGPIDFVLRLIDQISGPAKSAASSLRGVSDVLKSTGGAIDGLTKKSLSGWSEVAIGALREVGVQAVQMGISLVRNAVSGAVSLGKYAISAASFKRNALAAFTLIEGTPQVAQETYDKIKKIADIAPFETEKVVDTFKVLRSSGFGQQAAEQIFLALSDVSAAGGGGAEALGGLTESITKLKAMGKLNMEELIQISRQGGSAGLTIESILGTLATQRHQTIAQVQQQLSAGKIDSNSAIAAILETVRSKTDKGGALGDATKLFGTNSLEGVVSTFKSALRNLFEDINLTPIVEAFSALNNALSGSTPEVKALKNAINQATDELGDLLKSILTPSNIKAGLQIVVGAVIGIIRVLQALGAAVWELGSIFSDAFAGWIEPIKVAASGFGDLEDLMAGLRVVIGWVANILGFLVVVILWVAKAVWQVVVAISQAANKFGLLEALTHIGQDVWKLGEALGFGAENGGWLVSILWGLALVVGALVGMIVSTVAGILDLVIGMGEIGDALAMGLWEGFSNGIEWMTSQIPDLMNQIPDQIASTLGIASPSKVLFGQGANSALGFKNGFESISLPVNDNFASDIGSSPINVSSPIGGRSAGGDIKVDVHNTFNITSGDPADMQRAAEDGTRSGIAAALDRHAIGQGAVAA